MGQYHYTVNLDKKEFLHPHKLGDGLKLVEQINSQAGTMAALMLLLAAPEPRGGGDAEAHPMLGRWHGDRIAVVGDYAEDSDLPVEFQASTIFKRCTEGVFTDITDDIKPLVERECEVEITGDGWRAKNTNAAERPDFIIGL